MAADSIATQFVKQGGEDDEEEDNRPNGEPPGNTDWSIQRWALR
jgi:hypothetical protein